MLRKLFFALPLICFAAPAFAQYRIFDEDQVGTYGGGENLDFDQTNGVTSFEGHLDSNYPGQSATLDIKETFGVLKGHVYAYGYAPSQGSIASFLDDTLTFFNPNGPTTHVEFDMTVDGNLSAPAGDASVDLYTLFGDPTNPISGTTYYRDYIGGVLQSSDTSLHASFDIGNNAPINFREGMSINLYPFTAGMADDANYYDTVTNEIKVTTPGASYISASGHVYSVPEPATPGLLALGLVAVVRRRPLRARISGKEKG